MPILEARDLQKRYIAGDSTVVALAGVSLTLEAGSFAALMGPSGCGKSTLLHICGAMDSPSAGELRFEGRSLSGLTDEALTRIRRERVGFVFQAFNLLPTLTLADNVALPCLLAGVPPKDAERRAAALAARVGIAERLHHYPQQVSGGEMQRAAIARALVHGPSLLVADEPTGNLDSDNGARVLALLRELNRETGITVLLATHATEVAAAADRVIRMRDGLIVEGSHASAADREPVAGGHSR
jgi:putative ABC transport system ATP-binding protein